MNNLKKPRFLLLNPHFLIITVLALASVAAVSALGQQTQTQQHASQPVNLNTASEIKSTNNADETMGPNTATDNFANQLPASYLGKVNINLATSQAPSTIQSLKLTISKAELHLIHLFIPGVNTATTNSTAKPTGENQKTNQNVNKWETLQLNGGNDPINMQFAQGQYSSLGETQLAGGKYSEIRLYVSSSKATLPDGREVDLVIPGQNIIRILRPFNIYADKTTHITLDLDKQSSVVQAGNTYILTPFVSNITISN